jgi:heme O synthase-like polyprenyltransferase
MERRTKPAVTAQKRRRRMTFLWILVVSAVIITLLVLEQVAVLYVLATLSVTLLLIVVAWSDLEGRRATAQKTPFDDSAAIADARTTPAAATATLNTSAKARRR